MRFSSDPPYSSSLRFERGKQELMEQIAVPGKDLDEIQPELGGAPRRIREGIANCGQTSAV
jgi:hypothetical protein